MSFVDTMSHIYPGIEWHGKSQSHVSLSGAMMIFRYKAAPVLVNAWIAHRGFSRCHTLATVIKNKFNKFDYLVSPVEFATLAVSDLLRSANNMPLPEDTSKIVNPKTGSVFHLIGRTDTLVAGIRFWVDYEFEHPTIGLVTIFGWRVRITASHEAVSATRDRVATSVQDSKVALSEQGVNLDVCEPPKESAQGQLIYSHVEEYP